MIHEEVKGLYKIIPLIKFRETEGVSFEIVPKDVIPRIDGIDRVIHRGGAISPGPVAGVDLPWYMHPYQEDYLLVVQGTRYTDIYTPEHGRIEQFEVSPYSIKKNGKVIFDGPAMLTWPCHVFHRIQSPEGHGSAALNFAVRHKGFDVKTNFNIYDVDVKEKTFRKIREGHLDQF